MKRVYTHYEDGQTWLDEFHSDTYIDIPSWRWTLYKLFRWLDRHVHAWCKVLDDAAYEHWENRKEGWDEDGCCDDCQRTKVQGHHESCPNIPTGDASWS